MRGQPGLQSESGQPGLHGETLCQMKRRAEERAEYVPAAERGGIGYAEHLRPWAPTLSIH